MLLSDNNIIDLVQYQDMISPFVPELVREETVQGEKEILVRSSQKVISYGLSSYGYDIRLSSKDFKIFRHIPGTVINPKRFNPENLEKARLHCGEEGDYFILPGHSYGLGVAVEKLNMPSDVTAICMGKSTYARCGVIANITPVEAGWQGHLTLEFSNSSSADCRVYINEGVVQLLFLKGERCATTYEDRAGKYQGQQEEITLAKV
jgi:dCTP deaminase